MGRSAGMKNTSADTDAAKQFQIEPQHVVSEANPRGTKRKLPTESSSHDVSCNVPTHRLRKKTTLKLEPFKCETALTTHGLGKTTLNPKPLKSKKAMIGSRTSGNKQGKGKKQMVSIFEKEAILEAWDAAQASGDPEAKQRVTEMRGYFRGCHFDSKWGATRRSQQWPVFVKAAPRLMKKYKELPNVFRTMIHFPTMKCSRRGKEYETGVQSLFLPHTLQTLVEEQVVERLI